MKLIALISLSWTLGFLGGPALAATPVANPDGFPEYYCGAITPERFVGAPAVLSGDIAAVKTCAGRYAMAEAVMIYGTSVKFQGVKTSLDEDNPTVVTYVFTIATSNGVEHSFISRVQVDDAKNAPDGILALVVTPIPSGVCEGAEIGACH